MTNSFISSLEERFNYKFTENFGLAYSSTGSKVYDLFAFGGAYRSRSEADCMLLFKQAFEEDSNLAIKCLFYLRDCRGGQGERRFFRICYQWLAENYPEIARENLTQIPQYGRWDDLFSFFNTPLENDVLHFITKQLTLDMEAAIDTKAISLLGKWMPSENAHSELSKIRAKKIRTYIGMTSKEYRLMLSRLRGHLKVLEKLMSANRWDEIEFDKIPSKAGLIYKNAFARRDIIKEKYKDFAEDKTTKVNANTLYPYEVVEKAIDHIRDCYFYGHQSSLIKTDRSMINKYWDNLPDYLEGKNPSMLCVVDTSGSMRGRPINVAISLGIYCAERMTGPFSGKYISFASRPQLIKVDGIDLVDKVHRIYKTNLCDNTNLTAVFDLLLNTALDKNVREEDIPKTIVVISDMEIDYMSTWSSRNIETEMEKVRRKWAAYGLTLPKLVYWNVSARNNTILDKGKDVSFVSGCSPVIFKQVLTGKTGIELMLEVLFGERYSTIKV